MMEHRDAPNLTDLILQWLDKDAETKSQLQSDLNTYGVLGIRRQALYEITNTRDLRALRETIAAGGGAEAIDWNAVGAYLSRTA